VEPVQMEQQILVAAAAVIQEHYQPAAQGVQAL
jgi:hypothetical protein